MERSFWQSRWDSGQTGFHLERVNPCLTRYWPELTEGEGRVLVPLCGKSHDLDWLAQYGHEVYGVEFVPLAVEQYFGERGLTPEIQRRGAFVVHQAGAVALLVGDFFALNEQVLEPCQLIYDRAALVAVAPEQRRRYVEQLWRSSASGARLLLVNFVHDIGSGPPFSIPQAELEEVTSGYFSLELAGEREILEAEPRFRERGATFLREQVWFGRRLARVSGADV